MKDLDPLYGPTLLSNNGISSAEGKYVKCCFVPTGPLYFQLLFIIVKNNHVEF